MIFNGRDLTTKYLRFYGMSDNRSRERVLEWLNDIVVDIATSYSWPFSKVQVKKIIKADHQTIDLSPDAPEVKSSIVAYPSAGGFEIGQKLKVLVTFCYYDDSKKEISSIESVAGPVSDLFTVAENGKSVVINNLPICPNDSIRPRYVTRKVYVQLNDGKFCLQAEISNNTDTSLIVSNYKLNKITPPTVGLVESLDGDPYLYNERRTLKEVTLEELRCYDPMLIKSGPPSYYVRLTNNSIFIYPVPSSDCVLTFFANKRPAEVFDDENSVPQVLLSLGNVIEAGMISKIYEDKDKDGQESKKGNYSSLLKDAFGRYGNSYQKPSTVKMVM